MPMLHAHAPCPCSMPMLPCPCFHAHASMPMLHAHACMPMLACSCLHAHACMPVLHARAAAEVACVQRCSVGETAPRSPPPIWSRRPYVPRPCRPPCPATFDPRATRRAPQSVPPPPPPPCQRKEEVPSFSPWRRPHQAGRVHPHSATLSTACPCALHSERCDSTSPRPRSPEAVPAATKRRTCAIAIAVLP